MKKSASSASAKSGGGGGGRSVTLLAVFKSETESLLWDAWQVLGDKTPDFKTELEAAAAGARASGWLRVKCCNDARPEAHIPPSSSTTAAPASAFVAANAAAPAAPPAQRCAPASASANANANAAVGDGVEPQLSSSPSLTRKAPRRELSERSRLRREKTLEEDGDSGNGSGDGDSSDGGDGGTFPMMSRTEKGPSAKRRERLKSRSSKLKNTTILEHQGSFNSLTSEHSSGSMLSNGGSNAGGGGGGGGSALRSASGGGAHKGHRLQQGQSRDGALSLRGGGGLGGGEAGAPGVETEPGSGAVMGLRIPKPKRSAINVVEALMDADGDWDLLTSSLIRFAELAREQVDSIWGPLKSGGNWNSSTSGVSDSDGGGGASGSEATAGRGRRERGGGSSGERGGRGGGDGGDGGSRGDRKMDYEFLLTAVDCIANGASVCHASSLHRACEKLDSVLEIDRDRKNAPAATTAATGRGGPRGGGPGGGGMSGGGPGGAPVGGRVDRSLTHSLIPHTAIKLAAFAFLPRHCFKGACSLTKPTSVSHGVHHSRVYLIQLKPRYQTFQVNEVYARVVYTFQVRVERMKERMKERTNVIGCPRSAGASHRAVTNAVTKAQAEHYAELVSELSEWLAAFEIQADGLSSILSFPPRDLFHDASPVSSPSSVVAVIGRLRAALELLYDVYGTAVFVLVGGEEAQDAPAPALKKNRTNAGGKKRARLEELLDILTEGEQCCVGLSMHMPARSIRKVADLVTEMIHDADDAERGEGESSYLESEAGEVLQSLKANIEQCAVDLFCISPKDVPLPKVARGAGAGAGAGASVAAKRATTMMTKAVAADSQVGENSLEVVNAAAKNEEAGDGGKGAGRTFPDPGATLRRLFQETSTESMFSAIMMIAALIYIYVRFILMNNTIGDLPTA